MKKTKKQIVGFIIAFTVVFLIGTFVGYIGNMQQQRAQANAQMQTIDKITMFFIFVKDVTKAKSFYVDQLGFKATKDYEQKGSRWVTLVPPGGGTEITITNDPEDFKPGEMKMYLTTPDVKQAYQELTAKGVKPTHEIKNELWGNWFSLDDPDGNRWLVVQWKF